MSEAELAAIGAFENGSTLQESAALLPDPTQELLASLDERGDPIAWEVNRVLLEIKEQAAR